MGLVCKMLSVLNRLGIVGLLAEYSATHPWLCCWLQQYVAPAYTCAVPPFISNRARRYQHYIQLWFGLVEMCNLI